MKMYSAMAAMICVLANGGAAPAQETQGRAIGEVTRADAAARQLALKTDRGETITLALEDTTLYLRVPPGEKDLKKAARIALSDIGQGDRVLARGRTSPDGKTLIAASVIVMTKSDIAQKQQREHEEWQRRGTAGTVASLNPDTHEITVATRTPEGARQVVVEGGAAQFVRYAPDSVRFQDAKPGALGEIKPGDHLIVLGDRNEDGTRVKAERIVSGSFRNVAGTVLTVDTAAGELRITDLETKKPITVRVNADSNLRRLEPMAAAMLARRFNPPAGGPAGAPPNGPRRGGGDLQQMLERMPVLTLAELKPGDAIMVSSTRGAESDRVTAITLVAGVEPLLTAAPQDGGRQGVGGNWNFGDIVLPQ